MKTGSILSGFSSEYQNQNSTRNSVPRIPFRTGELSNYSAQYSDRESVYGRSKKNKIRRGSNSSMKSTRPTSKKKSMDFTSVNYREAVGRLKFLLAESYTSPKPAAPSTYKKHFIEDSAEDTDNQSQTADPSPLFGISKFLSTNYKTNLPKKPASKSYSPTRFADEYRSNIDSTARRPVLKSEVPQAPPEILNFIEKQEDYIEQLERESKYCRDELSSLLGKVRDVISENEALTEQARADLISHVKLSGSSESEDNHYEKIMRNRKEKSFKASQPLSGPAIVFESRISELEAELAQSNIDLKKLRNENAELKKRSTFEISNDPPIDVYRRKIESLERDKITLEETIRKLQLNVEELRVEGSQTATKTQRNRDLADMAIFEKSQAEIEIRRLKDELERQHERVRELQHEMSRRVVEERSNAERRYTYQVEQLGGDLSSQWEQSSKLQLDLERQKRVEADLKRELSQRNTQVEELKQELKDKKSSFLTDLAQVNAEKQSLEQEITSLRMQLDRAERQAKIETGRLTAEINSLRQRLDRADADILHARRENLRLNDDIANLEKDIALGEMKGEIRPTTKEINKTIMEMEQKHAGTVSELEEMIQNQRQLMDKLTNECRSLTSKLEDTTLKHKMEISALQSNVEFLTNRIITNGRLTKPDTFNNLQSNTAAAIEYDPEPVTINDNRNTTSDTAANRTYSPITKSAHHEYTPAYDSPKSRAAPTSSDNYPAAYKYSDEQEAEKESNGKEYNEDMRTEDRKPYEPETYGSIATDQQQNYTEQTPPIEQYSEQQYQQPDYQQSYDQQRYGESNYGAEYEQRYDISQYQGSQSQYNEYDPTEFNQLYQSDTDVYTGGQQPGNYDISTIQPTSGASQPSPSIQSTTSSSIATPNTNLQSYSSPTTATTPPTKITSPGKGTISANSGSITSAGSHSITESTSQPRKSSNVMGPTNTRNGDRGSHLLSQQPAEAAKKMPSS